MFNYRSWVISKAKKLSKRDALIMGAMGLAGEAGEVVDELKKHLFAKKPLDRKELLKELSDVRWYFEYLCIQLETDIQEIENINVKKLNKRYEKKYTNKASRERKDVK